MDIRIAEEVEQVDHKKVKACIRASCVAQPLKFCGPSLGCDSQRAVGAHFPALLLYMWVAGVWYGSSRLTGPQASMTAARAAWALWKP